MPARLGQSVAVRTIGTGSEVESGEEIFVVCVCLSVCLPAEARRLRDWAGERLSG